MGRISCDRLVPLTSLLRDVCRSLNSNRLTSVPASLGRLEQLSRLSLHINALTGMPRAHREGKVIGKLHSKPAMKVHSLNIYIRYHIARHSSALLLIPACLIGLQAGGHTCAALLPR